MIDLARPYNNCIVPRQPPFRRRSCQLRLAARRNWQLRLRKVGEPHMDPTAYEPRYLAGVLFFNAHDYFEAHDVWEDLWAESYGDDRRFVQGLIQAAVGLFHFHGGNLGGAAKLFRTSREYMTPV